MRRPLPEWLPSLALVLALSAPAHAERTTEGERTLLAFDRRCGGTPGTVNVRTRPAVVDVSHTASVPEIEAMMGSRRNPFGVSASRVTGLTSVSMSVVQDYDMLISQGSRGACVEIRNVNLEIGFFEPVKVHVARELNASPCARAATLEHEMEHVRLYDREVAIGAEALRKYVTVSLGAASWSYEGQDEVSAQAGATALISAVVSRATDAIQERAMVANAAIDTPRSYARLSASCSDWPSLADIGR